MALCVVMASEGYPGDYAQGLKISGLEQAATVDDVKVFHAGTQEGSDGQVLTTGGRVLGVTAIGNSISAAKLQAYRAVREIRWTGVWCRKDISDKALAEAFQSERKLKFLTTASLELTNAASVHPRCLMPSGIVSRYKSTA